MSSYTAVFEAAPDGTIWGWIPEIPGATGAGDTVDAAEVSLKAGLRIWVEAERELGRQVPPPSIVATRVVSTDAA